MRKRLRPLQSVVAAAVAFRGIWRPLDDWLGGRPRQVVYRFSACVDGQRSLRQRSTIDSLCPHCGHVSRTPLGLTEFGLKPGISVWLNPVYCQSQTSTLSGGRAWRRWVSGPASAFAKGQWAVRANTK
jgi:hypothetical protein